MAEAAGTYGLSQSDQVRNKKDLYGAGYAGTAGFGYIQRPQSEILEDNFKGTKINPLETSVDTLWRRTKRPTKYINFEPIKYSGINISPIKVEKGHSIGNRKGYQSLKAEDGLHCHINDYRLLKNFGVPIVCEIDNPEDQVKGNVDGISIDSINRESIRHKYGYQQLPTSGGSNLKGSDPVLMRRRDAVPQPNGSGDTTQGFYIGGKREDKLEAEKAIDDINQVSNEYYGEDKKTKRAPAGSLHSQQIVPPDESQTPRNKKEQKLGKGTSSVVGLPNYFSNIDIMKMQGLDE